MCKRLTTRGDQDDLDENKKPKTVYIYLKKLKGEVYDILMDQVFERELCPKLLNVLFLNLTTRRVI